MVPAAGVAGAGAGAGTRGLGFERFVDLFFFCFDSVQPRLEAIPVCRRSYKYSFENFGFVSRMLSLTHPAKLV